MRASELRNLLVATLVRQQGSSARRWFAVGSFRVYDRDVHPLISWLSRPHGTGRENTIIKRLLDHLQLAHSIIRLTLLSGLPGLAASLPFALASPA